MITDLDKYRAQCLQISGFCLMSPFGNLILNAPEYNTGNLNLFFFAYIMVTFILFCSGIICVARGEIHLERKLKTWIQE